MRVSNKLRFLMIGICLWGWGLAGFQIGPHQKESKPAGINWLSMEQAIAAGQKDGKKILVNFKTAWCRPCQLMDRQAFSKEDIILYINQHFHPVKFDAEKNADVFTVRGETYQPRPEIGRNGIHEWTLKLLSDTPAYPAISFLDADAKLITNITGYQKPGELMIKLHFIAEGAYQTQTYTSYKKAYKK